jgi:Ni/Co efflux regulator RcnB
MNRLLLCALAISAMLASTGGAAGSGQSGRYQLQNAWPSKNAAQKQRAMRAKTAPRRKESGEKGGTEDINIGVGELQEGKARPKLKSR